MLSAADLLRVQLRTCRSLVLLLAAVVLSLALLRMHAASLHTVVTTALHTSFETRIPRAALHPEGPISGLIILGGQPSRVRAAMELSQKFPAAPIILTGPGDKERDLAKTHLGNLIIEEQAQNTFENALYTRSVLEPQDGACCLLITSAVHMPRALGVFRAAGIPVAPWPVFDASPSVEGQTLRVTHELFGLIAYRLLGRTREFYPAAGHDSCDAETGFKRELIASAK